MHNKKLKIEKLTLIITHTRKKIIIAILYDNCKKNRSFTWSKKDCLTN